VISKRSRLRFVGILPFVLSVTVGLASGGVAEAQLDDAINERANTAKKKRGKGTKNSITVTAPSQPINQATGTGQSLRYGLTVIPFKVGKKAKGKVVGPDSVTVTFSASAPTPGELNDQLYLLSNPNGRTVPLGNPGHPQISNLGPVTFTPNSPNRLCLNPPCPDPLDNVNPPFMAPVGTPALALFTHTRARGEWELDILDTTPFLQSPPRIDSAFVRYTLVSAPTN